MVDTNRAAQEIGEELRAFTANPQYGDLVARAKSVDWSKASLPERLAVRDAFMAAPEIRAAANKAVGFGYKSNGIGGMFNAAVIVGGGGGGGVLVHDTSGASEGIGFAFGSAGPNIGLAVDFIFIGYQSPPIDFWGLFHGAFGNVHIGVGVGAFIAWLGAGHNERYNALLFAVGAGLNLGAGGFVGGAWKY